MRLSNQIVMGKIVGWTAIGAGIASLVGTSELARKAHRLDFQIRQTAPGPSKVRASDYLDPADLTNSDDPKKIWAYAYARAFLDRLDEQTRQATIDNGAVGFNGYDFPIRDGKVHFS